MSKRIVRIDRDQIRALSSPKRLEIHTSLRVDGPATAKDLAARLGADEMGLYYHLRLLSRLGLIEARTRPGATKPETVYSVEARYLVEGLNLDDEENLAEQCRNVDALLRAASKEHRRAAESLRNELNDRMTIGRTAVRLSKKDFKELQRRLSEVMRWLDSKGGHGDRYSLSFFAIPLTQEKD